MSGHAENLKRVIAQAERALVVPPDEHDLCVIVQGLLAAVFCELENAQLAGGEDRLAPARRCAELSAQLVIALPAHYALRIDALREYGIVLAYCGEFEKARPYLEECAHFEHERTPDVLACLGAVAERRKDFAVALECYRRAGMDDLAQRVKAMQ